MMDDAKRKKLRFKKTETSRLKTGAAAIPVDGAEVASDAVLQSESGVMSEAGSVIGADEGAAPGETGITDPMAMRDTNTSKVRRISADKESSPLATAVVPGTADREKKTETVQLKVVQQKKKEIASMISPSSTVRLRMPGKSAGSERSDAEAYKPIVPKDTMKLAGPPPPPEAQATAEPTTEPTAAEDKKTATQTLPKMAAKKPLLESAAAQTVAVSPPAAASQNEPEGEAGGTTSKSGGRTLKLRGGKSSRTVRIPSGADRDGGESTVRLPSEEMPEGASLDLAASRVTTSTGEEPGVGFTIAALVTLAAVAGLVVILTLQYLTHLQ